MGKIYITQVFLIISSLLSLNGWAQECDLKLSSTLDHPSCGILNDGGISLEVSGGEAPYSYVWNSGSRDAQLEAVSEGEYSVLITDAHGCQLEKKFILTNQQRFSLGLSATHPTHALSDDGSINISVQGGVEPFQFHISHYSEQHTRKESSTSLQNIQALPAGRYIIDAVDAAGCITTSTVVLRNQN
jgi:hypothetical protein